MPSQKSAYSTGGTTETFPGCDFTADEIEFLKAMERYQRRHARRYPTWREVLLVLHALGYRKEPRPGGKGRGQGEPNPSPPLT